MRVLVVDDQATMRRIIIKVVQKVGVDDCLEAVSANDALRILARSDVDLIITDWNMPGMTGLEFARTLRAQERTNTVPILMVTGRSTQNDVEMAMSTGITAYIVKPFEASTMIGKVKALLHPSSPFNPD